MRQARYVVRKAEGVGGRPIPENEPCIVIRGQDRLAPAIIDLYIGVFAASGGDPVVLEELRQHRDAIAEWQAQYGSKWADR